MKDYGKEEVLVVSSERIPLWEGVKPASQEVIELLRKNSFMILRNKAEGNPRFKQIIPYCVLCHTDKKRRTRLFHAQRKAEADRELSGKWTIGLGGHVTPKDGFPHRFIEKKINIINLATDNPFDVMLLNCAKRELGEEVEMDWNDIIKIKYLALIFTKSDLVSKDHLGVVLMFRLRTKNVRIKKEEFLRGGFFTEEEFLIYTDYGDWLHWLHETPEGQYMDRNWRKILANILGKNTKDFLF